MHKSAKSLEALINFVVSKNEQKVYLSQCYFTYYICLNNLPMLLPTKKTEKKNSNTKKPQNKILEITK